VKWPMLKLHEICRPKQWPTVTSGELTISGFPVYGANGRIGYFPEFNHADPTVLITCRGATCGTINICEPKSYVTGNSMALDELDDQVDLHFLAHYLRNRGLNDVISGSAQPQITREGLTKVTVPVPGIQEQRRIAAILDQAEALRAKRRQALAKLDTLAQSLVQDSESEGSSRMSISELMSSGYLLVHKDGNHGGLYPRADDFTGNPQDVPFISVKAIDENGEVKPSEVEYLSRAKAAQLKIGWIQAGDILLAHNASVGRVGIYRGQFGRALIGTSLTCFRSDPDKLRSGFLMASLNSDDFQRQLTSNMGQTTRNQVPITAQKRLKVSIFPFSEQTNVEDRLLGIHSYRKQLLTHLISLDRMAQSLQHRAFRGEL
jgi:type I restriction enzyme S subunit